MYHIEGNRFVIYHNSGSWMIQDTLEEIKNIIRNSKNEIPIYYWNKVYFTDKDTTNYHEPSTLYKFLSDPIGHIEELKYIDLNDLKNKQQEVKCFGNKYGISGDVVFYDRAKDKETILKNKHGSAISSVIYSAFDPKNHRKPMVQSIGFSLFGPVEYFNHHLSDPK